MNTSDQQKLQKIIQRFPDQPILVVGDLMLDRFVWGRVERQDLRDSVSAVCDGARRAMARAGN